MLKEVRLIVVIGLGVYTGLAAWSLTMNAGPFVRTAQAVGQECGQTIYNPCFVAVEQKTGEVLNVNVVNIEGQK